MARSLKDETKRNAKTGRGYKITKFSQAYADRNGHGRYYLALFEKDEVKAHDGWYCDVLRHARGDGEAFIKGDAA